MSMEDQVIKAMNENEEMDEERIKDSAGSYHSNL